MKQNEFTKILAQALAPAGEAVTVADEAGFIIEANDAVERVYGWPLAEVIGKHPLSFCPEEPYWVELSEKIWQSLSEEGTWDGVVMNVNAHGEEFPILLRVRLIIYENVRYAVSWAQPFPAGTPFGLSQQQARAFELLGRGLTTKLIGAQMKISDSTVKEHLKRAWKNAGKTTRYDGDEMKSLALRCLEAGWDTTMKLNERQVAKVQTC